MRCLTQGRNLSERNRFRTHISSIRKTKAAIERDPEKAKAILGAFAAKHLGEAVVESLLEPDWDRLFKFLAIEESIVPDKPMSDILRDVISNKR
jgi:hypothetical protein